MGGAEAINELAAKLGYLPVDADWGAPGRPADLRVPDTIRSPVPSPGPSAGGGHEHGLLPGMLRSRVEGAGERFGRRWGSQAAGKFLIVSRSADGGEAQWVVDAAARTVTADDEQADDNDVEWSILGSPGTWLAIMTGRANLYASLRHSELRYCDSGEDGPLVTQTRVAMLADLLGLSLARDSIR